MHILRLRRIIDNYWILIIFILVKFIGQHIVVNPIYELQRDEFLDTVQKNV